MSKQPSAFNSFPGELLQEIFAFTEPLICGGQRVGFRCDALTLSAVCSRWRQVCHESPELWSCYNLRLSAECDTLDNKDHHSHGHSNNTVLIPALEWCFSLSKSYPISVDIVIEGGVEPNDPLTTLVFHHSSRFQRLRVAVGREMPPPAITDALRGDLPCLQDLDLDMQLDCCPEGLLARTPNVKRLTSTAPHLVSHLPKHHITHAELYVARQASASVVLQTLARMPNLTEAIVYSSNGGGGSPTPLEPIQLANCRSLRLIELGSPSRSHSLTYVLPHLSLPRLSTLEFRDVKTMDNFPANIPSIVLDRSRSQRSRFSFPFRPGDLKPVLELLAGHPSITDVELTGLMFTSNTSATSTFEELGKATFLPNLKRLALTFACRDVTDQTVLDTVAYRFGQKLEYFRLYASDRDFDQDLFGSLLAGDDGQGARLKVDLKYGGSCVEIRKRCRHI